MTHTAVIHTLVLEQGRDGDYGCRAFPETTRGDDNAPDDSSFRGYAVCNHYLRYFGIDENSAPRVLVAITTTPQDPLTWAAVTFSHINDENSNHVSIIPAGRFVRMGPMRHVYTFDAMRDAIREMLDIPSEPFTVWIQMTAIIS